MTTTSELRDSTQHTLIASSQTGVSSLWHLIADWPYISKKICISYPTATAFDIKPNDVNKQVTQLSQRDRATGCVSIGQKWKTGTGRQYFMDIIGLFSTTVT